MFNNNVAALYSACDSPCSNIITNRHQALVQEQELELVQVQEQQLPRVASAKKALARVVVVVVLTT